MNKGAGKDRTFNRLNGANRDVLVDVQIHSTNSCLWICRHLLLNCATTLEWLFDGSMQIPLVTTPDELWTSRLDTIREIPSSDSTLIQLQHVPVQTLRTMLEAERSFHMPA